jgi:zinc transporter 9
LSSSVTISIATNSAIAVSKAIGWFVTGSPTLFAETIHSLADVGNQALLKVGEVRSRRAADRLHPFGTAQEKYFWALVSAVSVFFIGCGVNVYHGLSALQHHGEIAPFTPLVIGLLLFALALETWTFRTALNEIGGWRMIAANRHDTTVLAVLLEDAVALVGIMLTLAVGGVSYVLGPRPILDAVVAIGVGALLGVMALFLAAINRRVLIDTSNPKVDAEAQRWLATKGISADVRSLVLDSDRVIVFVRATRESAGSSVLERELQAHVAAQRGVTVDAVYWQFAAGP